MKTSAKIFDEFQKRLDRIDDIKGRVDEIIEFSVVYGDCFGVKIARLLETGVELARQIDYKVGETLCYCNFGFLTRVTGVDVPSKFSISLQDLAKAVDEIKFDVPSYAMGLNMLSYFNWFRGEYEKAFSLAFEALRLPEKNRPVGVAWNNFGLAVFYFDTKDFENSRIHYQRALDFFIEVNHEYGIARATNGLGTVAIAQQRLGDAIVLLDKAAGIYREMSHYAGVSRAVNDMGLIEKAKGNYPKAVEHLKEAIELRKAIEHMQGLITSYSELGETYQLMKDHTNALEQLIFGLQIAENVKAQQKEMRLHKLLYDTYKELGNTELALRHFERYFEKKAEILSDEAANNIKKVQSRFEREKAEKEAELERFKNEELKKANTVIEQKNKDITDSINYARRIQTAILPPKDVLDKCFKNYFVLYKPKDIVSGDFYWAVESLGSSNGQKFPAIAAVDCTGHGVPGAFMSMLGNTLLNQTIQHPEISSAAAVLDYLNQKLPENLKSAGENEHIRDGMDMGLCIFDMHSMHMQFAGANNPCWIVRDKELIELKGDKQAISASLDAEKRKFTNQDFDLKKDDMVYLFTDGYADQFGGPSEKKFTYKRLKELLMLNASKPLEQQKKLLDEAFLQWKGTHEQIDDVCLMGVRI